MMQLSPQQIDMLKQLRRLGVSKVEFYGQEAAISMVEFSVAAQIDALTDDSPAKALETDPKTPEDIKKMLAKRREELLYGAPLE
jgi:hypothetical protein